MPGLVHQPVEPRGIERGGAWSLGDVEHDLISSGLAGRGQLLAPPSKSATADEPDWIACRAPVDASALGNRATDDQLEIARVAVEFMQNVTPLESKTAVPCNVYMNFFSSSRKIFAPAIEYKRIAVRLSLDSDETTRTSAAEGSPWRRAVATGLEQPPCRRDRRLRRGPCGCRIALLVSGRKGPTRPTRRASRPHGRAGQRRHRLAAGRADLSDRARHRAGAVHGRHSRPGRRQAAGRVLQGGPARQKRRRAGQDRSAPLPGRARSGQGAKGAGRRGADRRQKDLERFQDAGAEEHSRPSRTSISSRPKSIRPKPRSPPTWPRSRPRRRNLDYTDIVATDRRPHGRAHGRSRQHRSCQRPGRDRDPDPDRADRR